jgi:poly-beta-1,6-N-acetyl-D-glucosamine N-deacetylase
MRSIKFLLALLCIGFVNFGLAANGEVVILDYHTFLGHGQSSIDYSMEEFGAQLDRIAAMGYKFVSLEDAIAGNIEGKANVVITIDDGNHSTYHAFIEVLKPRGIKPELFIYPAIVDRRHFALTSDQIRELQDDGCGIGAHGYYHEYMTEKAWESNPDKVRIEFEKPGAALERITGKRPALFAYPFGVGSPQAEEGLKAQGYEWGFSADDKIVPVRFDDPELPRYAVPRTIVYHWSVPIVMRHLAARLKSGQPETQPTAAPMKPEATSEPSIPTEAPKE